jgi:uncharacterized membrane protein YphA (DoxX/SURF4 family)
MVCYEENKTERNKTMSKFAKDNAYQAFRILQLAFVVAPIIAGLDKFFYLLTNWSQYIAPFVLRSVNYHDRGFMTCVGVVEIVAGILVWVKPKIFSYVVALWLLLIIINLLSTGKYLDIALRDAGLFLGALALGRLSYKYDV